MRVGRTRVVRPVESLCSRIIVYIVLSAVLVVFPYMLFASEQTRFYSSKAYSDALVSYKSLEPGSEWIHSGKLVHVQSPYPMTFASHFQDNFFGLPAPRHAASFSRHIEYCQWVETFTESTSTNNRGEEITTRTYFYTKSWVGHEVMSVLFNQPFAHHNPHYRADVSSNHWRAKEAEIRLSNDSSSSRLYVSSDVLRSLSGHEQNLVWSPLELQSFSSSEAAFDGFYATTSGYFYRPFVRTALEAFALGVGQMIEGSLLDFQLGDLFSHCTAGDIRVHFTTMSPTSVSALVLLQEAAPDRRQELMQKFGYNLENDEPVYELVPCPTEFPEFFISLLSEGMVSAQSLMEDSFSGFMMSVYITRALMFVWSLVIVLGVVPLLPPNPSFDAINFYWLQSTLVLSIISIYMIVVSIWGYDVFSLVILFSTVAMLIAVSLKQVPASYYEPTQGQSARSPSFVSEKDTSDESKLR